VGSITFFFENRAICEIMWKNIVEPDRPQMRILRMRIACWIPKATHKYAQYITLIACPLQQWLQEGASVLLIRALLVLFLLMLSGSLQTASQN